MIARLRWLYLLPLLPLLLPLSPEQSNA